MYYITLDLEWNQAYLQKALAVQKQLSCRLRGEVIQIGAVKLDKNMRPCGSYQIIVKPRFFKKLHKQVSLLTGITQQQLDMGTSLADAAERFRKWCGKEFVFLTWGPDDIPMLKENFNAHKISADWLGEQYDLQRIFARDIGESGKQRSLEFAMEYFNIPQNLPAHDALNDAYFTALVASHLDVLGGISHYKELRGDVYESSVIGDADAGDDGYVTISEMLEDDIVARPQCPLCSRALEAVGNPLHSKGQKYTIHYSCQRDGEMFLTLKLHRNFNDTWRAKRTVEPITQEKLAAYREGLEKAGVHKKARRRRSRSKRRTPSQIRNTEG